MKGILFKLDMVKAIAEGRKSQTRRLQGLEEINKEPDVWACQGAPYGIWQFDRHDKLTVERVTVTPRFMVGEVVFVQETYWEQSGDLYYKTDWPQEKPVNMVCDKGKWRSPRFMPARSARYFRKILSAEPQRLQEMTPADCLAEGIDLPIPPGCEIPDPPDAFKDWGERKREEWIKGQARATYFARCADIADHTTAFAALWDSAYPQHPWASNPWV